MLNRRKERMTRIADPIHVSIPIQDQCSLNVTSMSNPKERTANSKIKFEVSNAQAGSPGVLKPKSDSCLAAKVLV